MVPQGGTRPAFYLQNGASSPSSDQMPRYRGNALGEALGCQLTDRFQLRQRISLTTNMAASTNATIYLQGSILKQGANPLVWAHDATTAICNRGTTPSVLSNSNGGGHSGGVLMG